MFSLLSFKSKLNNDNTHDYLIRCAYHDTVGENGLGVNQPRHHYQIIQEVLYQQWFRWHGRLFIVSWQIQHWLWQRKRRRVWWHDFGFESILLILGSTPGGFIGPKNRCNLYTSMYSMFFCKITTFHCILIMICIFFQACWNWSSHYQTLWWLLVSRLQSQRVLRRLVLWSASIDKNMNLQKYIM